MNFYSKWTSYIPWDLSSSEYISEKNQTIHAKKKQEFAANFSKNVPTNEECKLFSKKYVFSVFPII